MSSALTQSELFALLSAGGTVVLPQADAARTLRARFHAHLRHLPAPANDPGQIFAWHEWTASLWSTLLLEGREERLLLNHLQEHHLWADTIAAHPSSRILSLQSPEDLATLARSALRLAASYNIVDRLRPAADTPDTRIFAAWLDSFRDHCHRQRLLPTALLDHALLQHLRSRALRAPGPLCLAGFEDQTPSQRDLLAALQTSGTQIQIHSLLHSQSTIRTLATITHDPEDELRLAVRLIADKGRQAPEATFAILLPNPADRRPDLDRLLRELLAPELEPVTADLSSAPWHFATQPSLLTSTPITHAFDLLRWLYEPLSTTRIGTLLLSPFLHFADSLESRARFETRILHDHRLLRPEFTLTAFLHHASQSSRPQAKFPELHALQKQADRDKLNHGSRPHADWADRTRTLLRTAGWPGPRALSPSEFAATESWESLLDLLSTLNATARRVPFATFLQQLEREAQTATLPALNPQAPVQVLTLGQAEGTTFDYTLLLNATDTALPALERLHSLIPRRLQADFGMPGADPAQTYARTRAHLQSLARRTGTLHLLAPRANDTGSLRLTPFAQDLNAVLTSAEQLLPPHLATQPIPLEDILDSTPLQPLPSNHVRGGARVLELQAACGFRAFATFRLSAGEISPLNLGIDPREAGSLLHKALELLWSDLKDQATLRALSTIDRKARVATAVRAALQPLHPSPAIQTTWTSAFIHILHERYTRLLVRWLDCELERSPFTILATEEERTLSIGPLELSIRIDRIDRIHRIDRVDQVKGGQIFIDYKTTYTLNPEQWLGTRPDAPQLPLYALLADPEQLRGIAFGRVRWDKDIGFVSLSDQPNLFSKSSKKPSHDLTAQREEWQSELSALAEAFADGDTSVDPKTYPNTCEYCAHRLLCRLDPTTLLAQATDEDLPEDDVNG